MTRTAGRWPSHLYHGCMPGPVSSNLATQMPVFVFKRAAGGFAVQSFPWISTDLAPFVEKATCNLSRSPASYQVISRGFPKMSRQSKVTTLSRGFFGTSSQIPPWYPFLYCLSSGPTGR